MTASETPDKVDSFLSGPAPWFLWAAMGLCCAVLFLLPSSRLAIAAASAAVVLVSFSPLVGDY